VKTHLFRDVHVDEPFSVSLLNDIPGVLNENDISHQLHERRKAFQKRKKGENRQRTFIDLSYSAATGTISFSCVTRRWERLAPHEPEKAQRQVKSCRHQTHCETPRQLPDSALFLTQLKRRSTLILSRLRGVGTASRECGAGEETEGEAKHWADVGGLKGEER
jgi:hypothetical protein